MIEYTLEFLVAGGMQEIFVYCVAHAEKIEAYLRAGKWRLAQSTMGVKVTFLRGDPDTVGNFGDALRDVDGRHIITNDFVLVCADVVSNVQLQRLWQQHKYARGHRWLLVGWRTEVYLSAWDCEGGR